MGDRTKNLRTKVLQSIVEKTKPLKNFLRGFSKKIKQSFTRPKPHMFSRHVVRGRGLDPFHVTRHEKIQSSFFTQKQN